MDIRPFAFSCSVLFKEEHGGHIKMECGAFDLFNMSISEDKELERKYARIAKEATDPLEKLQASLLRRGVNSISRFGSVCVCHFLFHSIIPTAMIFVHDDRSHTLNREEFYKGMQNYDTGMDDQEIEKLFNQFDKDGNGILNFDEFLTGLRPVMNACRSKIVMQAFSKIDKTGDGILTVEDLKGVYNVRHHKKYQSGEWGEKECLQEFLKNFDSTTDPDNKVSLFS
ncbi:hypothetical protein QZH41_020500 [Actinostola sp. cb2023]|nr:hypothetical protein QZH41_020500 [Actinostola sp. cb2023]